MKVLFAIGDDQTSKKIADKYYETYGETLEYKNVFYFKALLEEVKRDKTYQRIVISEDLERFPSTNYEAIDNFLFNKIDALTDDIQDADIIFICSDRRTKSDSLMSRLFYIGVYNMLIGDDRSFEPLCRIIKKPKTKREAKMYLNLDVMPGGSVGADEVEEVQLANILNHYNKLGDNTAQYVNSFDRISEQYSREQLKVIFEYLPTKVKNVIKEVDRYKYLVTRETVQTQVKENIEVEEKPKEKKMNFFQSLKAKKQKEEEEKARKKELEEKAKQEAILKQQEEQARQEALAKQQEEERARQEALAKQQAEERARQEAIARQQMEEKMKQEAEERARQEALIRQQLEEKMKKEAEERAKQEVLIKQQMEEKLKKEAEERARQEALAKQQEEEKAKQEALAKQQAEERARQETLAKQQEEEKARQKALAKQQEEKAKQETIEKQQAEERARQEALAKQQAEEKARQEALAKQQAEEKARQEALAKQQAEEKARQEALAKQLEQIPVQEEDVQQVIKERMQKAKMQFEQQNQVDAVDISTVMNSPEKMVTEPKVEVSTTQVETKIEQSRENSSTQPQMESPQTQYQSYTPPRVEQQQNYVPPRVEVQHQNVPPRMEPQVQIVSNVDSSAQVYRPVYELPKDYKKIAAFVGTHNTGTTFMVNAISHSIADKGVTTAIVDMTKDKGLFYIYTDGSDKLIQAASECMKNLSVGIDRPLEIERNLNLYTAVPGAFGGDRKAYQHKRVFDTLKERNNLILLDCDFSTPFEYFDQASEIYLVLDMDVLKLQEMKTFLRELKNRSLKMEKIKVIINKYVKCRSLTPKVIIESLSFYSDPAMTYTDDLITTSMVGMTVPFHIENYVEYLESIQRCKIQYKNYSKDFLSAIEEVALQVYPVGPKKGKKRKLFR